LTVRDSYHYLSRQTVQTFAARMLVASSDNLNLKLSRQVQNKHNHTGTA
jgi:hypothetical protein